jgi:hypothetical protein
VNQINTYVDIFIETMEYWCKLTNTEFEQKSFNNLSQISAGISNSQIKKAIEIDPEGFLPILVLYSVFNNYCRETRCKLYDLIHNENNINQLEYAKEISKVIDNPIIINRLDNEKQKFSDALNMIKKENIDIDNEAFIEILYEAKLAAFDLRVDQFSKGNKSEKTPILSNKIFQSYSVSNFIYALANNPEYESIVAMCLIKDAYDPLFSYFVVGIRNGQRVYVVSDKQNEPHPLYKTRTRRPGKHQADRMEKYWFPYYLLDFDLDYRGDLIPNRDEKGIVKYNIQDTTLCELKDMNYENLLWFVELYYDLVNKYFLNEYEKDELSYTGDMINIKGVDNELSKALVIQNPKGLMVKIPSTKEMSVIVQDNANFSYPLFNNKGLYEIVNIEASGNELVPMGDSLQEIKIEVNDLSTTGYTFDKNLFGTEKELTENVLFIARYNESQLIKEKLNKNFKERQKEIEEWYTQKINSNKDIFFEAIAKGEFITSKEQYAGFFDNEEIESNILEFGIKSNSEWDRNKIIKHDDVEWYNCDDYCAYNTKKSYYKATFNISTAKAIAKVVGVDIDELPIEIRDYKKEGRYSGNSILDRVDPVECIQNPYHKIKFDISMYISKSGYKQILKKYS